MPLRPTTAGAAGCRGNWGGAGIAERRGRFSPASTRILCLGPGTTGGRPQDHLDAPHSEVVLSIISTIRRVGRFPAMTCTLSVACAGLAVSPAALGADAGEATPDFAGVGATTALGTLAAIVDAPSTPTAPPAPAAPTPNGGWLDVSTWPLIPVPEIAVDPDSGATLGILPTWLHTNDQHEITPHHRAGSDGEPLLRRRRPISGSSNTLRPTNNGTWWRESSERVERSFDYEFQKGRLRDANWSINTSLIFDRSGTPRFYGFGNSSLLSERNQLHRLAAAGPGAVRLQHQPHLAAAVHHARATHGGHPGHAARVPDHRDALSAGSRPGRPPMRC